MFVTAKKAMLTLVMCWGIEYVYLYFYLLKITEVFF